MTAAVENHRPFELVLVDAKMPDMDGFEVAASIAKQPALAGATVIMLTSSGEFGDQSRCAEPRYQGVSNQAGLCRRPARRD